MARPVKMDSEVMLQLTQEYYAEKCGGDPDMLKIPKIGEYIRTKGYDIKDYLIRRNQSVIDYISNMKSKNEVQRITLVSVFRDMDVDDFIQKNSRPENLRRSLIERQNYYMEVAHSASLIFEENKKLKEKIKRLEKELSTLEEELESKKVAGDETLQGFRKAKEKVRILQDLVDTYLYPEIANELLVQRGIIRTTEGMVDPEKLNKQLVTPETEIKSNIVRELFKVFDS